MPATDERPIIRMCIDRVLPPDLDSEVQLLARRANPRNEVQRTRLDEATGQAIGIGFEYRKCWEPGRTLHVRFLDGDPAVQERVKQVAVQWTQFANIHFAFDDSPDAEIRISFTPGGSWSWIGMDCLVIPPDQPTMNLGWLTPWTEQEEYDRVVLHEFGHAIGAVHEHRRPEAEIPWNVEAVIAFYAGPPNYWDAAYTQAQVLDRYAADQITGGEFDPYSIMLYPVPKEHTVGGFEIPWSNSQLSDMDKEWAARMYPPEEAAAAPPREPEEVEAPAPSQPAPASRPPASAPPPWLRPQPGTWAHKNAALGKAVKSALGNAVKVLFPSGAFPSAWPTILTSAPTTAAEAEPQSAAESPPAPEPPRPVAIPAIREERIRLDVAHPEQVEVARPFDVVVAVLQADAPSLTVDDLKRVVSVPGRVFVTEETQVISYRVSITATDCDVTPPSKTIQLRPGESALSPLTFELTARRAGPLTFVVTAQQEGDTRAVVVAETRVRVEVQVPAVAAGGGAATAPAGAPTAVAQGPARVRSGELVVGLALKMAYVPTAVIHLLDPGQYPVVQVEVTNTAVRPRRLRVTSAVEGYSSVWADTVELEAAGGAGATAVVLQQPVFDGPALRAINERRLAVIRTQVEDLDAQRTQLDITKRIWMLPINSAPVRVKDEVTGELRDMLPYLGAFVTERQPGVKAFLKTVALLHPDKKLEGYYAADKPGGVRRQVRALSAALQQSGKLTYAPALVESVAGSDYQQVRLPRECLTDGLANCLEGVLLYCSLLEAMGLQAAVVWSREHAIVGWRESGATDAAWFYLDTTKVDQGAFEQAMEWGTLFVEENQGKPAAEFGILPIRDLRAQNITPLE